MKKTAVVYWSGTGNTERMAQAVAQGIQEAGAQADVMVCDAFGPEQMNDYDAFAFGCPAMGAEVLEECSFEPMFASIEGDLSGKRTALFGSFGWGDGQWMRDWAERCEQDGADLVSEGLMINGDPDQSGLDECAALGKELAG